MRSYKLNLIVLLALLPMNYVNGACVVETPVTQTLIRSDFKEGELTQLCDKAIDTAEQQIDAIVDLPSDKRQFANTILAFETINADLTDATTPLSFMSNVATDEKVRAEASECGETVAQVKNEIFSRRDLYDIFQGVVPQTDNEKILFDVIIDSFVKSGMDLSDDDLQKVTKLYTELHSLELKFTDNLNNDVSVVEFKKDELVGAPEDFLNRLKKNDQGNYLVTTKMPDYLSVMQNVSNSESRRKMLLAYENRQAEVNTKLLEQAISKRSEIAKLMGFATWADLQLEGRMAKDVKTVMEFLNGLKEKLLIRHQEDLKKFLSFKKELIPMASSIEAWDLQYLIYQLKKREYSIDTEKIREYFPTPTVIDGLFSIYSQLLGVEFLQIKNAKSWNVDVNLYEIHNSNDCKVVGYFYTDLIPRPGKYGAAASFPLIAGRQLNPGEYSKPISAMVLNLNPPAGDKPSLLSQQNIESLFHEFGHIMHQTLTRAPYVSLSGSNVDEDFAEAPAEMFEQWVWNADILTSISGHYLDPKQKLSKDIVEKIIAARDFDQPYFYTRQLLLALFDMNLHTQSAVTDVSGIYNKMYEEILGYPPVSGSHNPAIFNHIMWGYDAGYYGYLWSEVYATDMFSRFESAPKKLLDPDIGSMYRKNILEVGSMLDPKDMLRSFLGREPNNEAFFKRLHIKN